MHGYVLRHQDFTLIPLYSKGIQATEQEKGCNRTPLQHIQPSGVKSFTAIEEPTMNRKINQEHDSKACPWGPDLCAGSRKTHMASTVFDDGHRLQSNGHCQQPCKVSYPWLPSHIQLLVLSPFSPYVYFVVNSALTCRVY